MTTVKERTLRERLGERLYEILSLMAIGLSNEKIAEVLDLSPKTVGNYINSIYRELGLVGIKTSSSRVQVVLQFLQDKGATIEIDGLEESLLRYLQELKSVDRKNIDSDIHESSLSDGKPDGFQRMWWQGRVDLLNTLIQLLEPKERV